MSDPVLDADVLTLRGIIAAAEERGRRRGVEEGFRQGVENAAQYLKVSEPLRLAMHRALSDRVALAPRDSAPEPARMDTTHGPTCWCGKPSHHESGWCGGLACQGGAPRDSGKEPEYTVEDWE